MADRFYTDRRSSLVFICDFFSFWMITETSVTCFYKYFIMPIERDEILKISRTKYLKVQSLELASFLHPTASFKGQFRNFEL